MKRISFLLGIFILFLSCSKDGKNISVENNSTTTFLSPKLFIEGEWTGKEEIFFYPQEALEKPSYDIKINNDSITIKKNIWRNNDFKTEETKYAFQMKGSDTINIIGNDKEIIQFVKFPNGSVKKIVGTKWSKSRRISTELIPFEKVEALKNLK